MSENKAVLGTPPVHSECVSVLYEDEEIKVMFQPGDSSVLLVTFGDMLNLVRDMTFAADVPAKKLNLNCIGFMAKKQNWFPLKSVQRASSIIASMHTKFENVVTYGTSMGGYGAIKYSRLMRATAVIAFCPQWSIDKNECDGEDPGYQQQYRPDMEAMGIRTYEISGSIYCLYDPGHKRDTFHASKISDLADSIKAITVPSAGHGVARLLAGTNLLDSMIELACSDDVAGLVALIHRARRNHPIRRKTLLTKLSTKHPYLLERILSNPNHSKGLTATDLLTVRNNQLSALLKKNDRQGSINTITRICAMEICPTRRQMLEKFKIKISKENKENSTIVTAHRGTLKYCLVTGRLIHGDGRQPPNDGRHSYPLSMSRIGLSDCITVEIDADTYCMIVSIDGNVSLVSEHIAAIDTDRVLTLNKQSEKYAIRISGRYLSAEPNGGTICDRSVAKGWELFTVNPELS